MPVAVDAEIIVIDDGVVNYPWIPIATDTGIAAVNNISEYQRIATSNFNSAP